MKFSAMANDAMVAAKMAVRLALVTAHAAKAVVAATVAVVSAPKVRRVRFALDAKAVAVAMPAKRAAAKGVWKAPMQMPVLPAANAQSAPIVP